VPGGTYSYDAQNRLVSATVNGLTTEFTYDSRNRVVRRVSPNDTLNLTYSGWNLIEERDASGTLEQTYVHGAGVDELLVKITASGPAYYHHDGLGSTIALTGENGELLESYRYDAFGGVSVYDSSGSALPASPRGNRFLFTGREWLGQAGIYDYRNRVYSPGLGRFLQADPIRFSAGDVNLYRFVGNGPVNGRDPMGLETEIFIHRNAPAAGQPARNASGTMSVFHDGQFQFSTPVNQYGYQEGSNGIYPGTYSVLPRTDADPTSVYRNGTPAVTAPGQTNPGNAGNGYRNVYIHPEANMAGGDSRGCPTVSADAAQRIRGFMNADQRRGQNTTLRIFNYGGAPLGIPTR
jgi:RHS repeat-associated protein